MRIADAHNDLLMSFYSKAEVFRYLNFCKHNEVVKLFTAYYFGQDKKHLDKSLIFGDIKKKFELLRGFDFITRTFENIGFVDDFKSLKKLIEYAPFCVTLTWNYENKLAGGALADKGLSKFGKRVATELKNNNILVDSAHLNEKSFWDLSEIQYDMICSHTACSEIYPIKRNLSKEQLKLIGERKGFVGLSIFNTLLGGSKANFETIRKHLDVMLEFAGENSVGLGTDFNGTGEQNPSGISLDYLGMQKLSKYLSDYFSEEVLNKVFYQNLIKFEQRINSQKNLKLVSMVRNNNKKEQRCAVHNSQKLSGLCLAGEQRFEL